jgi:hypothetical protein
MPIISWPINLDDQAYSVELDHGIFSGKRTIQVNGATVHKASKFIDVGTSEHPFSINTYNCKITIHTVGRGVTYNFYVDGASQGTQNFSVMQSLGTMPIWGWVLELINFFLFVLILSTNYEVTVSAIIIRALITGVIFLVLFYAIWIISSHKSRSLRTRLVLCLLLTIAHSIILLAGTCLCSNPI